MKKRCNTPTSPPSCVACSRAAHLCSNTHSCRRTTQAKLCSPIPSSSYKAPPQLPACTPPGPFPTSTSTSTASKSVRVPTAAARMETTTESTAPGDSGTCHMVDVVYSITPWFLLFAPMPIHIRVFLHWQRSTSPAATQPAGQPVESVRVAWQEDHIILDHGPIAALLRWPLVATIRHRLPGWLLALHGWWKPVLVGLH